MMEKKITYLLRNIPEETYREFQRLAKARGLTIRTQLLLLMEDAVNAGKSNQKGN